MENAWSEYLDKKLYLPPWMREFHDQKLFFKIIHNIVIKSVRGEGPEKTTPAVDALSWMDLHALVVDRILYFFATRGYELRRAGNGLAHKELRDDFERCMGENPAYFWGEMPDLSEPDADHLDLREFDGAIKRLEGWTYEDYGGDESKNETMKPETLKKASDWVYELAGMYLAKYHEPMPVPWPLPEDARSIDLEWRGKNGVDFLASSTLEDDCDYYGEDKRTGEDLHGLFPANKEKNEQIVDFLHRMREEK